MPSRYGSEQRRSRKPSSFGSTCKPSSRPRSLSPLQALVGSDDSILKTVENEVWGKDETNLSVAEPANSETKRDQEILENRRSVASGNEQKKKTFCSVPAAEQRKDASPVDLLEEEYQWHDETLFNQAIVEASFSSIDLSDSLATAEKQDTLPETKDAAGRSSFSITDEFIFDDSKFEADDKSNFGPSDKSQKLISNCQYSDVRRKLALPGDGKKLGPANDDGSFYGLEKTVKDLILRTKKIKSLYDWQDECLNLEAVKNRRNLIYALPTSGGKTLVAEILMLKEVLCNKKNVMFILPYVAIAQEKVQSMTQFALQLGFLVEEYAGSKGQYPPMKRHRKNSVYICTIEKAQGLTNSLIELKRLREIGIVVVDELHLIGEDGGRGATLEGLLTKLMFAKENIHIVGMSATIGNLDDIARFLRADVYTKNFRPIEIKEYVKCDDRIWLLNLFEDPILTDEKKINYRYSEKASRIDPDRIGGLVMDVVPKDSCLLFCASRKNCENVALLLTRVLFRSVAEYKVKEKEELLDALKSEGAICPVLAKTVPFGVAYHHSGLTSEERRLLEDAFREGTLCVLCCTSTLAAGVNLPARRVILRSPYVGTQFLNLSRYKQMIGRAGRSGLGDIGESIIICQNTELPKVQELLVSSMDDCLSSLHLEEDRGINNLIMSSVMLGMAETRLVIHKLLESSLLGVQASRLDVNVKKVADHAIATLLKAGVLRVKRDRHYDPNLTVRMESQIVDDADCVPNAKKVKKTIVLSTNTVLELSPLGKAAMKGSIDLKSAFTLYKDLKTAQMHMVLANDLHLMYLVTPYDKASQLKPVGSIFYDVVLSLPSTHMETPRVLGIDEVAIMALRQGGTPKGIEPRVINRFWLTLILYELWQHRPSFYVAEKYQVNRGAIQNLVNNAASFANSVVRFCQELPEFWVFTAMLNSFGEKLRYCCPADLEPLMELPNVKVARARQLVNAGYVNLPAIAKASPDELVTKIKNFRSETAMKIIAAANLLLMEKVENLRDEAAGVLEGLDVSKFEWVGNN